MEKINIIKISHEDNPVKCPICSADVAGGPPDDGWDIFPCNHLLFVMTTYGFEYTSDKFEKAMGFSDKEELDEDEIFEIFINKPPFDNVTLYHNSAGAPSLFEIFYAFV